MIGLIACVGQNNELGKDNNLCFHIKEDMAFFKKKTSGKAVLMGRKTYESIGSPLKNRINYVLTSNPDRLEGNVLACTNLDSFLKNYKKDVFVVGGASVYAQSLHYADVIYLTEVKDTAQADTFFPDFDKALYARKVLKATDYFDIVRYKRRRNVCD